MEFKLNKVDPEVRQRVKETTSAGKIHTKTGIAIDKDNRNRKNQNQMDFGSELKKQKAEKAKKEKKILSVDAVKTEEVEVSAYKEETENEIMGNILDVRR